MASKAHVLVYNLYSVSLTLALATVLSMLSPDLISVKMCNDLLHVKPCLAQQTKANIVHITLMVCICTAVAAVARICVQGASKFDLCVEKLLKSPPLGAGSRSMFEATIAKPPALT